MITLTAKIDLISTNNDNLSVGRVFPIENNISLPIQEIVGIKKSSKNPFVLGSSPLGAKHTYQEKVDYFMGIVKSSSTGELNVQIELTTDSEFPPQFFIKFDDTNLVYPTKLTINGEEYANNSPLLLIKVGESKTTANNDEEDTSNEENDEEDASNVEEGAPVISSILINITELNKPNAFLVITGIYVDKSININNRYLQSMKRPATERPDYKMPSYGIISNSGDLEFVDGDKSILQYIENQLLTSGMKCEMYINNTLTGATQKIAEYESEAWSYDNDNFVVSVSLKDDLEEWQDITIDGIDYDPRNVLTNTKPLAFYYRYLHRKTTGNGNYSMLSFDELDEDTRDILENTYLDYPLFETCTLWQGWNKLCAIAQLHIYKNENGIVVCKYNGGN